MKAVIQNRYGSADVLQLKDIAKPVPSPDQALIRIHAVSINGSDRENLLGRPLYSRMGGFRKPRDPIPGSDIAGVVEAVGAGHSEFKPGDAVFGEIPGYRGGFAEYVCTHGRTLAHKPPGLSFSEAASIPQGGVIAWNGIRKQGDVQPGQRVLVNGAGGSAGVLAVQLAKKAGAEVTGVDSAEKHDFMRGLGADFVVDFRREDFARSGRHYDLILDLIAHRSAFACARALKPGGVYFFTGGSTSVIFQILILGPLIKRSSGKRVQVLGVPQNRPDLLEITNAVLNGEARPIIDREFPLEEAREAMRYVAEGRALGKVVIRVK